MRTCFMCKDTIDNTVSNSRLREIKKAAKDFPGSKKEEMNQIKVLTLKFANKKICEYCYLKEMAFLTTVMRIKAMKDKEASS
ncbi:hypothetical protein [Metabacillus rhizolycopersici]|uniref:Fe3+ hydroxamate ABC transporter substrate-binding protein n=1 Tax=Metabacillus rhizolycopersici TaxID=2875709 RepID=A0ABS7UZL9_9BACI|nr:hypothetical protein [Metabacillus rhizolycopersici]MBZ5753453.1 hypothetical protein [Metabacillus rhizolycopersici]